MRSHEEALQDRPPGGWEGWGLNPLTFIPHGVRVALGMRYVPSAWMCTCPQMSHLVLEKVHTQRRKGKEHLRVEAISVPGTATATGQLGMDHGDKER